MSLNDEFQTYLTARGAADADKRAGARREKEQQNAERATALDGLFAQTNDDNNL